MELLINNTIIYSFCVISSHLVLGGKKKIKKNIFSMIYASLFSCFETAMATANKSSWIFFFFKTSIIFTAGRSEVGSQINNAQISSCSDSVLPLGSPFCTGQNVTPVHLKEQGVTLRCSPVIKGEGAEQHNRLPHGSLANSFPSHTSNTVIRNKPG